eukprot:COSAG05_NODE_1337_length_5147_cov_25.636485_4_plen_286_part_00
MFAGVAMGKRSGGGAKSTAKGYGDGTRVQENPAAASEAKRPAGPKKAPKKAYDEVYQAPAPKKKKTASSTPMLAGAAALVAVGVGFAMMQSSPQPGAQPASNSVPDTVKKMSREDYDAMHRFGPDHVPESVAQVEVVDWTEVRQTLPKGTTLSDYLKKRNTALKLINSGPELWPATNWTPGSMLRKMEEMGDDIPGGARISMMEMLQPENLYFNEDMAEKLAAEGVEIDSSVTHTTMPMDQIYKSLRKAQDRSLDPMKYWYVNGPLGPPRLAAEVALPNDPEEYR